MEIKEDDGSLDFLKYAVGLDGQNIAIQNIY